MRSKSQTAIAPARWAMNNDPSTARAASMIVLISACSPSTSRLALGSSRLSTGARHKERAAQLAPAAHAERWVEKEDHVQKERCPRKIKQRERRMTADCSATNKAIRDLSRIVAL